MLKVQSVIHGDSTHSLMHHTELVFFQSYWFLFIKALLVLRSIHSQ